LCVLGVVVLALCGVSAHAGEERYDYDALGRLVRVIDEQGRVTEYAYDPAGNILEVRVSGAGTAQPPAITGYSPSSIRHGETKSFEISGTNLTGARVATSDAGLDISSLQVSATQITFTLTALAGAALGSHSIGIANAGGSVSVQLTVNPVLPKLNMSPLPIAVPPTGAARNFFVTLSTPDNINHVVTVASSNPAIATVTPNTLTFVAGETEKLVSVAGQSAGLAAINLTSPLLAPNSVPVFVTAEFAGITTSFAPMLQVVKEDPSGPPPVSFGPFASPLVGVAKGAYIGGVAPDRLAAGSGPTDLVISGSGLGGVNGVTVSPSDGLTLGTVSVAPDGTSVTVPVTVAANAGITLRKVQLSGSSAPYVAARPGADQFLITRAPPEIDSIAPIFATTGTTAATLTIRGRNLQAAHAVTFAPGTGISVSNTPSASADGTVLTVAYTVSPLAPTGMHTVTVTTPGGTSNAAPTAANRFSVVNEVQAVYTPIASTHLGVVKEDPAPPPAPSESAFSSLLGVVVPPAATGISPAVGIVGTSMTLSISGFGLDGVTAVQLSPADGVTLGALSPSADGMSVSFPVTIAIDAPRTLREVKPFVGTTQVLFTDPAAALFRVSAPLPEFDSMTPIVLQVGAAPVTLTITGRNFQNASQVRVDPPAGITVSPPSVNAAGTQATFTISAAAGAATGPRAVILATPAGESPAALSAANTLTLVNAIEGNVTPVASAGLGVVLESGSPPAEQSVGPFAAAALGVVLEDPAPPPPPQETTHGGIVGVAVGPFATGVQPPALTPDSTGTLVITGVGLADVTSVQIEPSSNIALGTLTVAPGGSQVSVPLTLSGAAAGLRGVRVLRGSETLPFVPPYANTFRIGIGTPGIDSITPILESRGETFTMVLRGQNFQGVSAVTATPGTGIHIDNAPSANAAGTEVTVRISIAADAPTGSHVFRVYTPGGATTDEAVPANTFTVLE
jgi:YD repeat-containing protein